MIVFLGAHVVGSHAQVQSIFIALAIQCGITSEDLTEIIFAYRTGSSHAALFDRETE